MKKIKLLILLFSITFILASCNVNEPYYIDTTPPAEPSGIIVINGDNRIDLNWKENRENDLAGYNIYYSYSYNGKYTLIGSTRNNYFIDWDVDNGVTYYYAVTAYDYNGNESELSYDVIYATPRPEGFNQSIFDFRRYPKNSGYVFSEYRVVPYNDIESDIFFEKFEGQYYLNVWDDTDIQDLGPTNDIYDIQFAPSSGWAPDKYEVAKTGHTYVIWTWDNHYAKIRIKNITNDRVVFDWAYQLVEGNNQLKPRSADSERKPLSGKKLLKNLISKE